MDFECRTAIKAPPTPVFDLSLSIDEHVDAFSRSRERAVGGVTRGQIGLDQEVTWRARHFGVTWHMTSRITEFARPTHFTDQQVHGPFKFFKHDHYILPTTDGTILHDHVYFGRLRGSSDRC